MKKLIWVFVPVITIGFLVVSALPAKAASFTFNLGQGLITATFDDNFVGSDGNTVRLTMTADNLVGSEFIDYWLFNFDPALDPTLLEFTAFDVNDAKPNKIYTGDDAFKADSYGWFDIKFDFPPPKGSTEYKFEAGESVIYDIKYNSTIDFIEVYSFTFGSSIVDADFMSAAHYQGSGGIISTPDASVMLLLGSSLIGLVGFGRRKVKK